MGGMFSDKLLEIDLSPLVPNEVWLDQTPVRPLSGRVVEGNWLSNSDIIR